MQEGSEVFTLSEGDFVCIKVHKPVCKDVERKGKLVPKAEGPHLVKAITYESQHKVYIADADDMTCTKTVACLSR